MTITLEPAIEARLQERAAREKQDADAMANALLANALLANALLAEALLREDVDKEKAFDQALLASGLITHIPPPRDPAKAERPRISVQGEPVSETILRERR